MKTIVLIGSTGSIGRQTLSVVDRYPDNFKIGALVANSSAERFLEQVNKYRPRFCALADETAGERIRSQIPDGVEFAYGKDAVNALSYGDTAVIASSGFSGLKYSLKAIENKMTVALANKETLVCGGEFVMNAVKKSGVDLCPVDSEHSALWQALNFRKDASFKTLIITASGGPFYSYTPEMLKKVTPADALKHPTWNMGAKITVDSATLLNKGFEVIEAHHLYDAPYEKIRTIVQPESIIHSMVEFEDGCVMAQMSYPTMELPIQLALTYPERKNCGLQSLDFEKLASIRFLPLERKKFPCYDLALTAGEIGGTMPCALNGAGEVAVHAFLRGELPFTAISETVSVAMEKTTAEKITSYEQLCETDAYARMVANGYIKEKFGR